MMSINRLSPYSMELQSIAPVQKLDQYYLLLLKTYFLNKSDHAIFHTFELEIIRGVPDQTLTIKACRMSKYPVN